MPDPSSFPPPPNLGRYVLGAKIADGGMASVYVARRDDGQVVALKMIREELARNREFLTMFLDEAKIVSRLRHPNIVAYYELGNESGQLFIAMELLCGQSLWNVWDACRQRGVRLRYDMIAWMGARVAAALHYAHELREGEPGQERPLGIVHRDVNATNIFVTFEGDIKVIDFGLAKAANRASRTAAGTIKGKVAYMSPEQAVGSQVDRRTDVFALGTTLWELACDRRLFKEHDDVKTLQRVNAAAVPDPTLLVEGFPPALWAILRRALARDPEDRPQTAGELARELDAFAGGGVDARVVAEVMRELFADDRVRQMAWITEASAPGAQRKLGPLKSKSTFWATGGLALPSVPRQPSKPPDVLAPAATPPTAIPPNVTRRAQLGATDGVARKLVPIVVAIVVVVGLVIVGALALR